MRVARGVFYVRSTGPNAAAESVECSVIAAEVIAGEFHSVRRGLFPLAAQLDVQGAAELVALLDDAWRFGDARTDDGRLSRLLAMTEEFLIGGNPAPVAARICNALAAAALFYLTVDELFRTKVTKITSDLRAHDSGPEDGANAPGFQPQLLVKAQSVLSVNPSLAISRVRGFRAAYDLRAIAPAGTRSG